MKKWFSVITNIFMKPTYKIDKSIFIFIAIIGFIISDSLAPIYGMWIEIILGVSFLIYIIKLFIERNNEGHIIIFVIGELIVLFMIILNYLKIKGKNSDLMMPSIPILIIVLLIFVYKSVLKSGDKERIEKVRVAISVGIPILVIMFLLMGYALLYL